MLDANACRSHSEYCRELAAKTTILFVRDDLLKMADLWLRLSKERDKEEDHVRRMDKLFEPHGLRPRHTMHMRES
jgi:hypothetical protein